MYIVQSRPVTTLENNTSEKDIIEKIDPVWFTYNGLGGMSSETGVGTIAQELEKIAPYMITNWSHIDEQGVETDYLGVDYGAMDFVLINAVKELNESIKVMNERINTLEAENKQLREK